MAAHTTEILISNHGIFERVGAFFNSLKNGLSAYTYSLSRAEQVKSLSAKSDEELAEMGLTRDQIPHFVFRDLFYV
jgi:uncharacterized protein YjiS (DUF1127 family)